MTFYIAIAVISTVTFTTDLILRYMEKIRSFGMEERIHNIKGKIIPIEDFIPHNLTLAALSLMSLGISGIILKLLGMHSLVTFPITVMCGMFTNFGAVRFLRFIRRRPLPKDADLSDTPCLCTEDIDGSGYGSVEFRYNGRKYEYPALSANETDIKKGEKPVIILINEGVCFVEREDEIIGVLNEK